MKGYKVFNPDWTCRDFQFGVGKTFTEDVTPVCCEIGFHFCTKAADCFNYYSFDPDNKVAEVEALGDIAANDDGSKYSTNKIHIIREFTWQEVLDLVNHGKGCTGFCNSGNWNSGDCNSGNWNSGDRNSGNWNSGNWNSGDHNSGNRNSGDWNSGNRNSGDWNSGNCNSGNCNSGNCNSGNCNSGNWNSGNWNSGDWNKANFSNGCFNTKEPKIYMFNKSSNWTYRDWLNSDARRLLSQINRNIIEWVYLSDMTDEEKEKYQEAETTGGYLKTLDSSECGLIWWDGLSKDEKKTITSIPNFDKEIFKKITRIDIEDEE